MADAASQAARGDPLFAVRPGGEFCRSCGGPWFGEVAYCPYCGRASTLTTDPGIAQAPQRPTRSWKSWAKPVIAGAVLGLVLVMAGELAIRAGVVPALKAAVQGP
jgi:hypothetical protein